MGGENPYLEDAEVRLPERPYRVTFRHDGRETQVEVRPDALPQGYDGREGSLLSIALAQGVPIDHACGGVCACSTCHVVVERGLESCNEASEDEEDMLDLAPGLTPNSRLACQCVPDGSCDLVVEIPAWNRNLAREEH
ncbi:MAG: ferredoxin [Planctomycetota bacterium]|nr:MAG: ferredoxin [Planctomycetota bacterium]